MIVHKRLMCCEGTVVGLKLSDDGVHKHRKAQNRELIMSEETHCSAGQLVNRRTV